jgi:trehalose-6-phosphatase
LAHAGTELHAIDGANTLNVLPTAIRGKGEAVGQALKRLRPTDLPIYIGDDATDEPAFAAVREGITVRVGQPGSTRAGYYLSDTEEVRRFLERLDEDLRARHPTTFKRPRSQTRHTRPPGDRRPPRRSSA